MSLWLFVLAIALAPAIVVAAVLLWIAANGVFQRGGLTGEAALSIVSLGRALRSLYNDTVRQSVPDDFLQLLGKLSRHTPRATS
jgi:hypothetical protein